MIRRLTQAVACLIDTRHAAALDELTGLLDENVRLIEKVANLAAENQSLRMILKARDVEIGKLRKDFSDLVRGVVSE